MSASPVATLRAVTPAPVRRRLRQVRSRGPLARPVGLAAPVGRPVQPAGPALASGPVRLRSAALPPARVEGPVQLTERGILVVVVLIAAITLATVAIGLVKFFGVSNAPLDGGDGQSQAPSSAVLVMGA